MGQIYVHRTALSLPLAVSCCNTSHHTQSPIDLTKHVIANVQLFLLSQLQFPCIDGGLILLSRRAFVKQEMSFPVLQTPPAHLSNILGSNLASLLRKQYTKSTVQDMVKTWPNELTGTCTGLTDMHGLSRNTKAGLGCCFQAIQAVLRSNFFWIDVIIPRRAFSFTGPKANSQPGLMAIYQMPPVSPVQCCQPAQQNGLLAHCRLMAASSPHAAFITTAYTTWAQFFPKLDARNLVTLAKRLKKKRSHNPVTHSHFTSLYFSTAQKQFPQDYKEHWHLYHLGPRSPALFLSSLPFPQYSFSALAFCSRDVLCKQTQQTMERADCFITATWPRPKLWVGNNKVTPCSP